MAYAIIRPYRTTRKRYLWFQASPTDPRSNTELILTTDHDGKKKTLDRFRFLCHDTQS